MATSLARTGNRLDIQLSDEQVAVLNELTRVDRNSITETRDGFELLAIPPSILPVLENIVRSLVRGDNVHIGRMPAELSTTVAARHLGVSRPTLMKIIKSGELPSFKVGSHTRVHADDLVRFMKERLERQRLALEKMEAIEFEVGL